MKTLTIGYKYIKYNNVRDIVKLYKNYVIEDIKIKIEDIEIKIDKENNYNYPNILVIRTYNMDEKIKYENIFTTVKILIVNTDYDLNIEIPKNIEYIIVVDGYINKIYENSDYGLLDIIKRINRNKYLEIINKMLEKEEYNKINYNNQTLISFMLSDYDCKNIEIIKDILNKMDKELLKKEDDYGKTVLDYFINNKIKNKEIFDFIFKSTEKLNKNIIFRIIKNNYLSLYIEKYSEIYECNNYLINKILELNNDELINSKYENKTLLQYMIYYRYINIEIINKILDRTTNENLYYIDKNKNNILTNLIRCCRYNRELHEIIIKIIDRIDISKCKNKKGKSIFSTACRYILDEELLIKIYDKQDKNSNKNIMNSIIFVVNNKYDKLLEKMIILCKKNNIEINDYILKKILKYKLNKSIITYYKLNKEKLTFEIMQKLIKIKIINKIEFIKETNKNHYNYNIMRMIEFF